MFSKFFVLLAIALSVHCDHLHTIYYDDAGNANEFVDNVLKTVMAKYNQSLDPFKVPDQTASFSKKIGIITLHGSAKLEEGSITGLSHIHRSGDSSIGTDANNHFTAHITFGDNNIHAHFKVDAEFEGIKTHATLDSTIGDIAVEAKIGVDANGKPTITEFKIDELKHVKIDIKTPIKILDHFIDMLGEGFVTVFNPVARDVIGKILKDVVDKELQNFKLP